MSKKTVDEYFKRVLVDYHNLISEIKDFEKECVNGLIEPERLDEIKANIQPLMNNYERCLYIMYLYNQPQNKKKHKAYEQANKKLLSNIKEENKTDRTLEENKEVLNKVHTLVHGKSGEEGD